ncbi:MAG: hypothetical protein KJO07_10325 [Deltaproteobacteria bacterium]|nr:hypothetical protein [Deltaproteobacteria bacterium]
MVYEQAVTMMGLEDAVARLLLSNTLEAFAMDKKELSIEELGNLLPELETRFGKFLSQEETQVAMGRLRNLIFDWAEDGD